MPQGNKPSRISTSSPEQIKQLARKKGVTIVLDMDGSSQESKMDHAYSYSSKSKTLLIVADLLEKKDKPLLLEIIRKVFTGGGIILKKSKEELLASYKAYSTNNNDKSILAFFEGVLTKDDFSALKMSLYLRDQQNKGENVAEYKRDIRQKFGDRGANIANLCTAGYFEEEFMPLLYNSVSKEKFYEYYEIVVGKKAKALFVHGGMGEDELELAFNEMLEKAIKYHIKHFHVHGLGYQNVSNIKEFFSKKPIDPENKYIVQKEYENSEPALVVVYGITIIGE